MSATVSDFLNGASTKFTFRGDGINGVIEQWIMTGNSKFKQSQDVPDFAFGRIENMLCEGTQPRGGALPAFIYESQNTRSSWP